MVGKGRRHRDRDHRNPQRRTGNCDWHHHDCDLDVPPFGIDEEIEKSCGGIGRSLDRLTQSESCAGVSAIGGRFAPLWESSDEKQVEVRHGAYVCRYYQRRWQRACGERYRRRLRDRAVRIHAGL